jgi:hypothetical protein
MLRWTFFRSAACVVRRRAAFSTSRVLCSPGRKHEEKINYNSVSFTENVDAEHANYPRVTATELESLQSPPTEVKMLVRDFIEDSLYNPHYGYFPKQATIFTATDPINFRAMKNGKDFQNAVAKRYEAFELNEEGPGRQIWHTPTELFKVCWHGHSHEVHTYEKLTAFSSHGTVKRSRNV